MASYHMRRHDRAITDQTEIDQIIKAAKFAVIAMCRNNEPYIVTLSCGYDQIKRCLYFHAATTGQKLDFIRQNPNVCATIIVDKGYLNAECAHQYASLVIRGKMQSIDDLAEKKHGLAVLLYHLEANPGPIVTRNIPGDETYNSIAVLRLDIQEISAKQGQ